MFAGTLLSLTSIAVLIFLAVIWIVTGGNDAVIIPALIALATLLIGMVVLAMCKLF